MRSAYLFYDDFRRPAGGVIKLSRACFGCSECTFHLAQLNDGNYLGKNNRPISIHVESVHNYLHNFRRPITCATIKVVIVIQNGWSLKLHQT